MAKKYSERIVKIVNSEWPVDCPKDEHLVKLAIDKLAFFLLDTVNPSSVRNFLRSSIKPPSSVEENNKAEPIPTSDGFVGGAKTDFACGTGGGSRVVRKGHEMS